MEGDVGNGPENPVPWLRGDFVTGYEFLPYDPITDYFPHIPVGGTGPIFAPTGYYWPGTGLPQVPDQPGEPSVPGTQHPSNPGPGTVVDPDPQSATDPNEPPGGTIPGPVSGGDVWAETGDTDWERAYNRWVILNSESGGMAVDWGDIIGQVAAGYFAPDPVVQPGAQFIPPVTSTGTTTYTGTVQRPPCKRRRRRRLLTSSDLADLASLKAIVGGGAAMNAAVVKAVRR